MHPARKAVMLKIDLSPWTGHGQTATCGTFRMTNLNNCLEPFCSAGQPTWCRTISHVAHCLGKVSHATLNKRVHLCGFCLLLSYTHKTWVDPNAALVNIFHVWPELGPRPILVEFYKWMIFCQIEHLFEKNLTKYTICILPKLRNRIWNQSTKTDEMALS